MEYEKSYIPRPEMCPVMGTQEVLIGVPVEVKPFAEVGRVKTKCIGGPIIKRGSLSCEGKPRETCKFTISQKMRIEVPVAFGAKTQVGQARVDCNCSEESHEPCGGEGCSEQPGDCPGVMG